MANPEHLKIRLLTKIISYIIYIVAFSCIYSFLTVLQEAAFARSHGYSAGPVFSEPFRYFSNIIPYIICQVAAAAITIKVLSLRKLFYLSCVFAIMGKLISYIALRSLETIGQWDLAISTVGRLLPYIAPILILALINRKKTAPEPASDVEKEIESSYMESEGRAGSKIKFLYSRYWYILDIFLIIFIFLCGIPMDHFGLIAYVCGLYNKMTIWAVMVFMLVFLFVPASLCLLVLLLRMFITWPKHITKKRRLLLLRVFVIIGLTIYLMLPFTPIRPPGMRIYIAGFSKYVKANADIEAIRGWLGTLKPEDCVDYNSIVGSYGSTRSSPKQLKKQEWPKVIANLHPRYVVLSLDDEYPKVRLNWGSGLLGSWGLVVGNESMEPPASDLSRHGEYRLELCKGAYVWYEIE